MKLRAEILRNGRCGSCENDEWVYVIPKQLEADYGCHMELCWHCVKIYIWGME
jgi:hypothetical protein